MAEFFHERTDVNSNKYSELCYAVLVENDEQTLITFFFKMPFLGRVYIKSFAAAMLAFNKLGVATAVGQKQRHFTDCTLLLSDFNLLFA